MNIYFSLTERNEVNFPTSNLSTTITNTIINTDELEELNSGIDDSFNQEDIEISEFYKKYRSKKKLLKKTESQKKLNKIKVYFIVKSKIVNEKEVKYALPIRSFDDLSNSILERSNAFIASIFHVKVDTNLNELKDIEGSPGLHSFWLDEVIDPEPPFPANLEFPLKNLILPKKYVVTKGKLKLAKHSEDNSRGKMVIEKSIDAFEKMKFSFPMEYEYYESMINNTVLVNSSGYCTDIRQKNSFNGEKDDTGFLSRCKDLHLKEGRLKLFNISNSFPLFFGTRNASLDKNIIPVFSHLEDAQDLLITILEELHQPFQVRRKIENYNTTQYFKNLSYLNDSFSFQNNYFLSALKIKLALAEELLMKSGIIESSNLPDSYDQEFYHENQYQTKGPFFLQDTDVPVDNEVYVPTLENTKAEPKPIWGELDYWSFSNQYFPDQEEAYSWWESRDMTNTDKGLLKNSQDIKIIAMGLGDFLEFWNNPTKKNAEVLFIPSSNDLSQKEVPSLNKKSSDKFYDYQQKFRGYKKQNTENYIYEIKLSAE